MPSRDRAFSISTDRWLNGNYYDILVAPKIINGGEGHLWILFTSFWLLMRRISKVCAETIKAKKV